MMGRARLLGRAAALGTATFATLLATGMVGSADAAQAATHMRPANAIPCNLTVSNPAYTGSGVSATAVIRCAYPTSLYLEVDISYNGNPPVAVGQSFPAATWVDSLTVTTSAAPGYYQASAIAVLGDGEQYGTTYSNNVYIPQ
jgi:hypothetical protein